MDVKPAILTHARDAISRSQTRPVGPIPRNHVRSGESPPGSKLVVDEMVEKLEDYPAKVIVAPKDAAVPDAVDELLGEARSVVVPAGLPEDHRKAAARGGHTVVEDSREEAIVTLGLNEIGAVLTCSHVGVSISGTVVLDGEPDQGRRAILLAPDKHVVVLERKAIMLTVPRAVDVLGEHPTRPMTWIIGGSATSDIELVRVNGVHGPRNPRAVIAH